MDCLRVDVVSLFDLSLLESPFSSRRLEELAKGSVTTKIHSRFSESFNWLFYHSRVSPHLPSFRRIVIAPPASRDRSEVGRSLLVSPDYCVGVFSVWNSYPHEGEPLARKHSSRNLFPDAIDYLSSIGLQFEEIERHYPFVAVQANIDDVNRFCDENAEQLGRLFTGGWEHEDRQHLMSYLSDNLSKRRYEKLLLRWTEALAVYGSDVESELYEKTLFRAVQVFETCILIRRLLRNINARAEEISGTVAAYRPRPWAVNRVLNSFGAVEKTFLVAPPVQSVEAERLLKTAYERFGIQSMLESTRKSCDFLEKRYQWAKGQFLGVVAIAVYVVDKVFGLVTK